MRAGFGRAGFIGSHIVDALDEGHEVVASTMNRPPLTKGFTGTLSA